MRLALAVLAALLVQAGSAAAGLSLVYVEANVGGASGGHMALRIDDLVYNFQFESGGDEAGLLVLVRERWHQVRLRYGTLENRPLHLARVPLADADLARVRDHFDRIWLEQQHALDAARVAADDVAHLEALAGRGSVRLRGAGLLDPERRAALALRARVAERLGPDFLATARARAAAEREALAIVASDGRVVRGSLERARELLTEEAALRALDEGWDLAPEALVADGETLAPEERAGLEDFGAALEADVLALLGSPRPDRGSALLLATARRLAVARSLARGRLVLLDPLPDAAPTLDARALLPLREELVAATALARREWTKLRRALLARPLDEISYNRLEEAAARVRELDRAVGTERGLRLVRGRLVPSRTRNVRVEGTASAHALEQTRARSDALRAALLSRWGYELVTDNCVHAVSEALADALGGEAALHAALGIDGDPTRTLGFIPAVFFARVGAGAAEVERLPSYRERALASLYERGSRAAVYARESNRLTSRIYRYRHADGSFLFFTSDVVAQRPLYGVANIAWALGEAALGVATAPFDRGRRLVRAAKGAFFSAPELVFMSVRKGTFDLATLEAAAERAP